MDSYFALIGAHNRGDDKRQLHTTHVGAVGWEPHRSSPTTSAGKADHGLVYVCPLL